MNKEIVRIHQKAMHLSDTRILRRILKRRLFFSVTDSDTVTVSMQEIRNAYHTGSLVPRVFMDDTRGVPNVSLHGMTMRNLLILSLLGTEILFPVDQLSSFFVDH